jgi:hypothetical protein
MIEYVPVRILRSIWFIRNLYRAAVHSFWVENQGDDLATKPLLDATASSRLPQIGRILATALYASADNAMLSFLDEPA